MFPCEAMDLTICRTRRLPQSRLLRGRSRAFVNAGHQNVRRNRQNMRILDWNRRKVQNLSPFELWLFIVGRVLVGFGVGILAMAYFPRIAYPASIPVVVVGFVLLVIAFKGFARKSPPPQ